MAFFPQTTWVNQYHSGCYQRKRWWGGSGSGIGCTTYKSFPPRSRQITMPAAHHSVYTGWMLCLPPNQQRQSTVMTLATERKSARAFTVCQFQSYRSHILTSWSSYTSFFKNCQRFPIPTTHKNKHRCKKTPSITKLNATLTKKTFSV